jgi:hypothetical protein
MSYDADYPKKPMGGGNPYYACAYCGITDPQINGNIKNHSTFCEYRKFKEFGVALTHDGYGNEIPKEPGQNLSWEDKSAILLAEGWTIVSQDPLVLIDEDGDKLEGFWAKDMLSSILYEYEN